MVSKLDLIVEQLSAAPKRIFLIDGLGALLTTFLSLTVWQGLEVILACQAG